MVGIQVVIRGGGKGGKGGMCICVGEVLLVCIGRGGESMCGRVMCVRMCECMREKRSMYMKGGGV